MPPQMPILMNYKSVKRWIFAKKHIFQKIFSKSRF